MEAVVSQQDKAASVVFWQRYGTPLLRALLSPREARTTRVVPRSAYRQDS